MSAAIILSGPYCNVWLRTSTIASVPLGQVRSKSSRTDRAYMALSGQVAAHSHEQYAKMFLYIIYIHTLYTVQLRCSTLQCPTVFQRLSVHLFILLFTSYNFCPSISFCLCPPALLSFCSRLVMPICISVHHPSVIVYVHLSICPSVYRCIFPSVHRQFLFMLCILYMSICLSIHLPFFCLSFSVFFSLYFYIYMYLYICLFISFSVYIFIYISVFLICLFISFSLYMCI